jgi:hypothetical protein
VRLADGARVTRFISGAKWQPIIVIDRTKRRRRTSNDVIALVVSGAFLLAMSVYAITEVIKCH